ncbi:GDSL-type esterase/lipase family protein [uncultured Tateyamaria sp.]|uniref:GDSL-type esterase/lipase family protein n=1 Tax=uncultured Tateyamaria sp. TaxID=455651 RepID=UPI00260B523E|nr:GDSL-type esterase/lipase family protein [uncultured Tateyamaria sp.]
MPPRTVLCFGDSNTHGTIGMTTATDRRRHDKPDRWPSVMARSLPQDWDIIPEGHPGHTAVWDDPIEGIHKNGARALHAILESHRPVVLVILLLGTKDLKSRFGLSAHDIALGLQRLVTEILGSDSGPNSHAPGVLLAAPIVVQEVGVLKEAFAGAGPKSAALPALLKNVASRHGTGFIDLNDVAYVDPVDGVHLCAGAHAAIGAAMAKAVANQMN